MKLDTGVKIDGHVHVVGNGAGGTGCWLRIKPWQRPLIALMLRQAGLPSSALQGDLDRLYADRLLEMVRASDLDHIIILAQDNYYLPTGEMMEGKAAFYVPNDYVLSLARRHKEFLPAVSIHPARRDALDELSRCAQEGAVMLKILPNCHNIDCNDSRYKRFWESMAAAGLPLLAHTGGEHTLPVTNKKLSDPRVLTLPLQCGVKVIAAHCGTKSGLFDPQYFQVFAEMCRQFPNLYGDNSAFNVPIRGGHVPECLRSPLAERIIHGSDFPVPVSGLYARLRGYISGAAYRQSRRQTNPLQRDYQLKRDMGFASETFNRVLDLMPQRLSDATK